MRIIIGLCLVGLVTSCQIIKKDVTMLDDKKIMAISGLTKKEHYARNNNQPVVPQMRNQITSRPDWRDHWHHDDEAYAHNLNGAKGNESFRGINDKAHIQVVFDQLGQIVTSDENQGTYDFGALEFNKRGEVEPKSVKAHFEKDVIPWIFWGNTPQDKTTIDERFDAILHVAEFEFYMKFHNLL